MKKQILIVMIIALCFAFAGCGAAKDAPVLEDCAIEHDVKYGNINAMISIDDFHALGFEFGDSLNVAFSNGYTMEDLPYYNGFYVDIGDPEVIGYPGAETIQITVNYGDDPWETAGVTEKDTVTISLAEKGKYKSIQDALDLQYSDDRADYENDEVFGNFRAVRCAEIKPDTLYRSASPCDNKYGRADCVDDLCEEAGIRYIMDLSDSSEEIEEFVGAEDFDSDYFLPLYESDNVIPLDMNADYHSEDFARKVAEGFIAISEQEGPYLIHCVEGKDRTGFVCALAEALAGASYEEIVDDYMLSYENYYGITEESDPESYDAIKTLNIDGMLTYLAGCSAEELPSADLAAGARKYLHSAGMSDSQIDAFLERIAQN